MSSWDVDKEEIYKLKLLVADLRQKLQDECDGAEEALRVKDEEIAALRLTVANQDNRISELLLRCSNLGLE